MLTETGCNGLERETLLEHYYYKMLAKRLIFSPQNVSPLTCLDPFN